MTLPPAAPDLARPIRGAAGCAFAPYDIPNVLSLGFDVVSDRSNVAAYRAPGAPIGGCDPLHAASNTAPTLALTT